MVRVILIAACGLVCGVGARAGSGVPEVPKLSGGIPLPEPTAAGDWFGSWVYVNRDQRFGFFLRPRSDGLPELKVRYQGTSSPEAFETDWNGRADYLVYGKPATFEMKITDRDAAAIRGEWTWNRWAGRSWRRETGAFVLYRAIDGRKLVLHIPELARERETDAGVGRRTGAQVVSFIKASRRIVRWEELPF